jgi:hypothetical protein
MTRKEINKKRDIAAMVYSCRIFFSVEEPKVPRRIERFIHEEKEKAFKAGFDYSINLIINDTQELC